MGRALHVAGVHVGDPRLVDLVLRVAGEELLQRDAAFEARDGSPEAHVRAVAEREDSRVGTEDVEVVGTLELPWVAVPDPSSSATFESFGMVTPPTATSRVVVRVMYCVGLV